MIYTDRRHRARWMLPRRVRNLPDYGMEVRCDCGWTGRGTVIAGYMEKLLTKDFMDHMKPRRDPVDLNFTRENPM